MSLGTFALNIGGLQDTEFSPQLRSVLFDDFMWEGSVNLTYGAFGMVIGGLTGGGPNANTTIPTAAAANHPGLLPLATGVTNNATGAGYIEGQASTTYPGACASYTWEYCIYTPAALSTGAVTYTLELGFRSAAAIGRATNAFAFLYDQAVSTNWAAYTANNGSATTVTTADANFVVNAASYYTLKIVAVANLVSFYVASGTGDYALLGTSATNLPDSTHKAWLSCMIYKTGSATTTSTSYFSDWMKLDTVLAR